MSRHLLSRLPRQLLRQTPIREHLAKRSYATQQSNIPAIPATPTAEELAADPQLAGLGYPIFAGQSRQHRPAKRGWWDEQERANQEELLSENEDVQTMWGPDVHPNFPGVQALQYLGVASLVMAGVTYFIYLQTPAPPMVRREYPYDGLKQEMLGKADSEFVAARPQTTDEDEE